MTDDTTTLEAGLFAVDLEARTIRGVLIPWGEQSRTSVSKTKPVRFPRGNVSIPADPMIVGLNREHDRFDPVGRAVELLDEPIGLVAEFSIAKTPEGDAYLREPGNLRRLSAEVKNIRRYADGTATADLTGAALVSEGAFESAALFAIDDKLTTVLLDPETPQGDPEDEEDEDAETTITTEESTTTTTTTTTTTPASTPAERGGAVNTEVPNTFSASSAAPRSGMSKGEMFSALSAVANNRAGTALLARMSEHWGGVSEAAMFALSDIDYDGAAGVGAKMSPPQWLGEILDGTNYVPRFAPLFGHADLTALAMSGWKWNVKPKGGAWTGNKDAIPSNTASVTPVSENADRWAGGHDHAREHRDFGTPGYFESYYAAMVEDYFRWLDEDVVLAAMVAGATEIEADNPAGLTIGAAMSALVDGAAAVVSAGLIPTFAVLPTAAWKSILKTPNSDVLGYLNAALGLDEGTLNDAGFIIRPSAEVTNTFVGAKTAADVYELPGSPIRAEALNIANGGIDTGLFGYGGLLVKNAAGIVEVTPYTP